MFRCQQPPLSWLGPPPFSSALRKSFFSWFCVATLSQCAKLTTATPSAESLLKWQRLHIVFASQYCLWSHFCWHVFEMTELTYPPLTLLWFHIDAFSPQFRNLSSYCCLKRTMVIIFWECKGSIISKYSYLCLGARGCQSIFHLSFPSTSL